MAAPMHTVGQSALTAVVNAATLVSTGTQGATLMTSVQGAAVTAVALGALYPSDAIFPSDSLFPDSTYLPTGLAEAVLAASINAAALAPRTNEAHLTATSSGGAALTSVGGRDATIASQPVAAAAINT